MRETHRPDEKPRLMMPKPATDVDHLPPVHPGEVLSEEFLIPLGLSARALAERINVPPNRVSTIAAGKRGITGDTALRLASALGTTPEFWMNLQKNWELAVARDESLKPHRSNHVDQA